VGDNEEQSGETVDNASHTVSRESAGGRWASVEPKVEASAAGDYEEQSGKTADNASRTVKREECRWQGVLC
jgi:hypothetical protein